MSCALVCRHKHAGPASAATEERISIGYSRQGGRLRGNTTESVIYD